MSLGARLRERREQQQVSLRTIAEQTKISLSLLEGLEHDNVSNWPGGIFRRAFVRAYAQAIGLDPDATLREFLERHPDPDADTFTAFATAALGQASRGPIERFRSAIGAAARERPAPAATVEPRPEPDRARADPPQANAPPWQPDFAAVGRLCTALGRVEHASELVPLLQQAATILEATGIVLWSWDPDAFALRAMLGCGYSERVLAHLPTVDRDAGNATAAAFTLGEPVRVDATARSNGALVVPILTPIACAGVLAIEVPGGRERNDAVHAVAAILAAQLASMMRPSGAAADRKLA